MDIDSLDPGNVPTIEAEAGLPGGESLVLAKFKNGDFDLSIASADGSLGAWTMQISLVGDVNGDFLVNDVDTDLLN